MDRSRSFTTVVVGAPRGAVVVPVPFDPDEAWGPKPVHHVHGTVGGRDVRGVVERAGDGWCIRLGPTWACDRSIAAGDEVAVVLAPEGPQRADLESDIVAALGADPAAAAFFDSLAQFYRRAYLRWIDATKRRPDVRAERIAKLVRLCREGVKQRP